MRKERKEYVHYREIQRERILTASEELFIRNGIQAVSVDTIANAAQMTRKTFYQYFQNKEEVARAILEKFQEIRDREFHENVKLKGNGYERLEIAVYDMCGMLDQHPDHVRFMVEFSALFAQNHETSVDGLLEVYSDAQNIFLQQIERGIGDGSIAARNTPEIMASAIINLIMGLISRFSLLGERTVEAGGISASELLRETCRIFLLGMKQEDGE